MKASNHEHKIPTQYEKYWKSIQLWNRFSRLWKYIEFAQNVHKVLKKYENSKLIRLFIQMLFFTDDDSSADVFCIVFHL